MSTETSTAQAHRRYKSVSEKVDMIPLGSDDIIQ